MPPLGVYVGLDWLRFTGAEGLHRFELERLLQAFAGTKPERNKGAAYFSEGKLWKPGLLMSWGHRSEICQVDIQGGRLRLMTGDDRMKLLRALMDSGMKVTRIDGCIDFVDQGHELYANAKASCERDELCRLRSYGDNSRRTVGQRPDRLHLNLGRRDSPVCGRIYDKGLETKTTEMAGCWERLEIEWKGDRVQEVGQWLYHAGQEWAAMLTALVFGAVDFREVTGQTKLDRRPRCKWWECVVAKNDEVVTSPASKSPDLARWIEAFRVTYGRRVKEFAAAVGRPSEEVFVWLTGCLEPSDNGGQLVREFERAFCTTPGRHVMSPSDSRWPTHSA
ncbi:MAG: replication initiation factor domain-containing protein [Phycisphaeraceae bacterium]